MRQCISGHFLLVTLLTVCTLRTQAILAAPPPAPQPQPQRQLQNRPTQAQQRPHLNTHVSIPSPLVAANRTVVVPLPLRDVHLTPFGNSFHHMQQQQLLLYVLAFDVDSLLYSFRLTAGIDTRNAKPYPGWEDPACELRGHFVGHFLSATAFLFASTGDAGVGEMMARLVEGLVECQLAMGTGYLSAFPTEEFDRLEKGEPVWAPYYTIHKIMAGLLDQHVVANSALAWKVLVGMADYFCRRVASVLQQQGMNGWQSILDNEWGGMNEVMYNIYALSHVPQHLELANLFDHYSWSVPLALGEDDLGGNHANTHIPEIVGAQRGFEVTGNATQRRIAEVFFRAVRANHSYSTGGSNYQEFWSVPRTMGSTLTGLYQEESCTQYNILKVARHFYQQTASTEYMDFYEHAMTNGIIGNQRIGGPGEFIYMLPQGMAGITKGSNGQPGDHSAWGRPFGDFWCCYGTLTESFAKLGDSIYFTSPSNRTVGGEAGAVPAPLWPEFQVVQYVSSTANWTEMGVEFTQESRFFEDPSSQIRITKTANATSGAVFTLSLRIPRWSTPENSTVAVNGTPVNASETPIVPGQLLSLTRRWALGDVVEVRFSMAMWTDSVQDNDPAFANSYAVLYGPVMLVGLTAAGEPLVIPNDRKRVAEWLTRDDRPRAPNVTMTFTARITDSDGKPLKNVTFIPFFQAMGHRYTAYANLPQATPIGFNPKGSAVELRNAFDLVNGNNGAAVYSQAVYLLVRSGDPPSHTAIDFARPLLDANHTVIGVDLDYQYQTGYTSGHNGTNFTLWVVPPGDENSEQPQGRGMREDPVSWVRLYSSPPLADYPYDTCPGCCSPPVRVRSLPVAIRPVIPHTLRFTFDNYDRNLLLRLNINLTVHWQ